MSRSVNKAILVGNVGQDPEIRTTNSGSRVANFSLATSRQWTGPSGDKQEKTEWHRCIVWNTKSGTGGLVDVVEKYVHKGERVYVEGQIEYRTYQDKENQTRYVTEIRVQDLMLLGTRGGGASSEGDSMGGSAMGSGGRASGGSRSGAPSRAGSAAGSAGSRPTGAAAGGEGGEGGGGQSGSDEFEDFPGALEDEDDDLPF